MSIITTILATIVALEHFLYLLFGEYRNPIRRDQPSL